MRITLLFHEGNMNNLSSSGNSVEWRRSKVVEMMAIGIERAMHKYSSCFLLDIE